MYGTPFLWANLQPEYKSANSLEEFKSKIKTWKCDLQVVPKLYTKPRAFLKNQLFLM